MNLFYKFKHTIFFIATCYLFFPNVVFAETATFDDIEEGMIGNQFTDGDITFFGLDNGHPDVDNVFIIEQADGTLSDPSFSPPNGLTATAHTPGADLGFGAIKEMSMGIDGDADAVSIDVFTAGTHLYANTVTLEAIRDGVVVDSISIAMSDVDSNQFNLALDGTVFDELRLVSEPNSQVLLLDNVTITPTGSIDECACDIYPVDNPDGVCDSLDYTLFREDWGRTDCRPGSEDECECNIAPVGNLDNSCDSLDYTKFREDWRRPNCRQ